MILFFMNGYIVLLFVFISGTLSKQSFAIAIQLNIDVIGNMFLSSLNVFPLLVGPYKTKHNEILILMPT